MNTTNVKKAILGTTCLGLLAFGWSVARAIAKSEEWVEVRERRRQKQQEERARRLTTGVPRPVRCYV